MLIIDDNMFRLAKMQETLLKVSTLNRKENLEKYIKTVTEIDAKAFADILEEIKHIDRHNHSLESELDFLEGIQKAYEQLVELQSSFKRVCELYGNIDLELSDLSVLNIEYINSRCNAIKGYLTNKDNIEENEKRAIELSNELAEQLEMKETLDRRLLELEDSLRDSFVRTEGRCVVDGKLTPTSIVIEYKKIDLDFVSLLSDADALEKVYLDAVEKKDSAHETLQATQVCHINNNGLITESKQFLEDAKSEYFKAEYRLTMIKILKLLSQSCAEYDKVVSKREDILKLIDHRFDCLECLGLFNPKDKSIEPFSRTKVQEQLVILRKNVVDNSRKINAIRKELDELMLKTEQMMAQRTKNKEALSETRSLIESKVSMGDIAVTIMDVPVVTVTKKEILPNQVVGVREVSRTLNMSIIEQKTTAVIGRVNQMVNHRVTKKDVVNSSLTPELVIVPSTSSKKEDAESRVITFEPSMVDVDDDDLVGEVEDEEIEQTSSQDLPLVSVESKEDSGIDLGLFETVIPFSQPVMFSDRTDELTAPSTTSKIIEFPVNKQDDDDDSDLIDDVADEMPDAFWITQDTYDEDDGEDLSDELPSFDDQIDMLLSKEKVSDGKVRKKVA